MVRLMLKGGSLAIPDGERVIEPINKLLDLQCWESICATQDFHPADHISFRSNHAGKPDEVNVTWQGQTQRQILWPDHCIQGTHGCELHQDLNITRIERVFKKGYNSKIDSYSAFADSFNYEETGLDTYLKENDITRVFIVGLAEDFCVFHTALAAGQRGYETIVVEEAIAGIAPLNDQQKTEHASNGIMYRDMPAVLEMLHH